MAANTQPIYTKQGKVGIAQVTGVDGSADGTDVDVKSVFTADSTNGSFISKVMFTPISTSGSTTTSVAVGRVYYNNGSTVGTATNNNLLYEIVLPATAVNVAATAAVPTWEIPLNIQLPANAVIYVGVTAMAANTSWRVTGIGGDY